MSMAADFEQFCKNLRTTNSDVISYRYHQITKRLNADFWGSSSDTDHSFYTGSYGRGTAIFTSDIDMVFQLPYDTYRQYDNYSDNGQSQLLQAVKRSIQKTYPSTDVGGDGQVVQVTFSDGVMFEVVPAFLNNDESYTYPDSNNGGSWKTMDPKAEMDAFDNMNAVCNRNLKRLCRMIRAWNNEHSGGLSGQDIDTIAYRFMVQYGGSGFLYSNYGNMSREFMKYLYNNADQSYWAVPGSGRHIYPSIPKYKAKNGYEKCDEAIQDDAKGWTWSCRREWREHYGTKYPNE